MTLPVLRTPDARFADLPGWAHEPSYSVVDAGDGSGVPGRPARPVRVSATEVPTRSPFTDEGRAALVHSICHIEFNAIKIV